MNRKSNKCSTEMLKRKKNIASIFKHMLSIATYRLLLDTRYTLLVAICHMIGLFKSYLVSIEFSVAKLFF